MVQRVYHQPILIAMHLAELLEEEEGRLEDILEGALPAIHHTMIVAVVLTMTVGVDPMTIVAGAATTTDAVVDTMIGTMVLREGEEEVVAIVSEMVAPVGTTTVVDA